MTINLLETPACGGKACQVNALSYQTEVCTTEILFAEYIAGLVPLAETFCLEERLTTEEIDRAIMLVRELRELSIGQLTAHVHSFANCDPFFERLKIPLLVAIRKDGFTEAATTPLSMYLLRLSSRHPEFEYDISLQTASEQLFQVAVSAAIEDEGKHFLLLPDQKELLLAAKEGTLKPIVTTY